MKKNSLVLFGAMMMAACGGSETDGPTGPGTIDRSSVDPAIQCKSSFCGDARFLAAVPTTNTVLIRFGANQQALADLSPAFQATEEHIEEINGTIDDVFGVIEEIASEEPTTAEDALHIWEGEAEGAAFTLEISTDDETTYDFELDIEDEVEAAGVTGTVVLNENDEKESFEFQIDFDALGEFGEETGSMVVRALPSDDGVWEITYDLEVADDEAEVFETTRYWVIDGEGGAIEYTFDGSDSELALSGDVYVRWDEEGGRLDALFEGESPDLGGFELVQSDCWDSVGGELFTAEAVFSDTENYSDIDGAEEDCLWELTDAHPDLEEDIEAYFDDESWEEYDDYDSLPDDFSDPDNNANNLNNLNNANNVDGCDAAADTMNSALIACDYEPESNAFLCMDPEATIACADALDISDDICFELDNNPDCF